MSKKIVFIGAGSPYVPAIVHEIAIACNKDMISEVVFITRTEKNLSTISDFCTGLFNQQGIYPTITERTSVDDSIQNADMIFLIYRVGGMTARMSDETIGINFDVISQESQGVGGFSSALRHIALLDVMADSFKKWAPNAWIVNLTNPTGIMTYAAEKLGLKSIGICEAPYDLVRKVAEIFSRNDDNIEYDFIGLNHLGWMIDVHKNNVSLMEEVTKTENLSVLLPKILPKNIILTSDYVKFVQSIQAIPSSYLPFYYHRDEFILHQKTLKKTRAEEVLEINDDLYDKFASKCYGQWPEFFKQKRSGYLLGEALSSVVSDILGKSSEQEHIICFRNGNAISNISQDAILEMPVKIINGKIVPKYNEKKLSGNIYTLIAAVSEYEILTVNAALSGDRKIALEALVSHPLIPSIQIAHTLLEKILDEHMQYLPIFAR